MRIKIYTMVVMYSMLAIGCSKPFLCAWGEADQIIPNRLTGGHTVIRGQSYESCMGQEPKEN